MTAETLFHLIMISLIAACIMGCGIAAAVELSTEWRMKRRWRKMHNRRFKTRRAYR
jgi:hypothetical protein